MFYSLQNVFATGINALHRQTEQKRCLLEKYLLDIHHQNSNRNTKYYIHIALNTIVFLGGTVHLRFAFPFKEEQLEDRKKRGENHY